MGGHNVSVQALGGVSRSEGIRCFLAGGVGGAVGRDTGIGSTGIAAEAAPTRAPALGTTSAS